MKLLDYIWTRRHYIWTTIWIVASAAVGVFLGLMLFALLETWWAR